MTYKLNKDEKYIFATDLDGTFLTDFVHSLHIDAFDAVQKVKDNGHHFIITTGRSWWWTKTVYEQLGSVDASIHFSGAIVHHPLADDFEEYRTSISQVIIKELIKELDIWSFADRTQAVGRKYHATWSNGDDLNKLFFNCYEYIIDFEKDAIDTDELIKRIGEIIGDGYIVRVWTLFGEEARRQVIISPQGATKSEGLKKIAKYYGVDRENVIYFGDNVNDIDALIWAGHSYAPLNAREEAKEAADEVLEQSCDHGVVPKKIMQLIDEQNERN